MKRSPATFLSGLVCSALWFFPNHAVAEEIATTTKPQSTEAGGQPGAVTQPLDEIAMVSRLRSVSETEAIAAARKLGETTPGTGYAALFDVLSLGVSPKVAAAALSALTAYRRAESLPLFELYVRHRNPELRKRALQGLSALVLVPEVGASSGGGNPGPAKKSGKAAKPVSAPLAAPHEELAPKIVPLLLSALGDTHAEVRAVAAETLGQRREKTAEPALIKLLLRKDSAAPSALGLVGGPETARALGEMIGSVPNYLITQTLGELLRRPDFGGEPVRTEVVKMLGKMPGDQPVDFLTDYLKATDGDKEMKARPSRAEAQKIIEQRTAK